MMMQVMPPVTTILEFGKTTILLVVLPLVVAVAVGTGSSWWSRMGSTRRISRLSAPSLQTISSVPKLTVAEVTDITSRASSVSRLRRAVFL